MSRRFCFGLILCLAASLEAAPPDAAMSMAKSALAHMPLRFEANQGQWKPDVLFAARTRGLVVAMTASGPSLRFGAQRVAIALAGSRDASAVEPLDRLNTRTDYYLGHREDWHTAVPSYSRVRYRQVYPGIDAVYYGNPERLEYDFVLAPGADPSAIRMDFQGAERVRVTPEGDLSIETASGSVLQKKPVVVQNGRKIAVQYAMAGSNRVGFKLGRYNRSQTLVIDPELLYSTYIGGSQSDQITAVRLDPNGTRLYLAGWTQTSDIPVTDGADYSNNASSTGTADVFVMGFDVSVPNTYTVSYTTYLGGTGDDYPMGMALDGFGNIFVVGHTTSTDFPMAANAIQTTPYTSAGYTGFVAELGPAFTGSDQLEYSSYLGGTDGTTSVNDVAVDAAGNFYVIGTTRASDFPVTGSAYASVRYGLQDAFLTELNSNSSSAVYSTYLGGEAQDEGRSIAVTSGGLAYFGITTQSTQFPLAGNSYRSSLTGSNNLDVVIGVMDMTKYGTDSLRYSTYLGGSDNEEVRKIALDSQGNLMVTGYTLSTDFPVTSDAAQPVAGGNGDAFVSVVNPNKAGFLVYSTYLGGTDGEVAYDVAADSAGSIYVTGYTLSKDFPVFNPWQDGGVWGGGIDTFVSVLKRGTPGKAGLEFSTYLGGASLNAGYGIAVDSQGRVFVGGMTSGLLPETSGCLQGFGGGYEDGFLTVFSTGLTPSAPRDRLLNETKVTKRGDGFSTVKTR
jgi:hypothetical protein